MDLKTQLFFNKVINIQFCLNSIHGKEENFFLVHLFHSLEILSGTGLEN